MINIEELSYNELKAKCAELNLGGKGSAEELRNKLKNHFSEDESVDANDGEDKKTHEAPKEAKAVQVIDGEGNILRQYTPEQHGDSFIDKAKLYVETRPKQELEVQIIE